MPFVQFFSATFGSGVNASHCPITRPKRRIPPDVMRNKIWNFYEMDTRRRPWRRRIEETNNHIKYIF
jgi:hypothetical protein